MTGLGPRSVSGVGEDGNIVVNTQMAPGSPMSLSEDHIRRAVDEVLEPVWPVEARRAARSWNLATLARATTGIVGIGLLLTVIQLIEGRSFPWTFLAFMAVLTMAVAFHAARDPEHLRRQ